MFNYIFFFFNVLFSKLLFQLKRCLWWNHLRLFNILCNALQLSPADDKGLLPLSLNTWYSLVVLAHTLTQKHGLSWVILCLGGFGTGFGTASQTCWAAPPTREMTEALHSFCIQKFKHNGTYNCKNLVDCALICTPQKMSVPNYTVALFCRLRSSLLWTGSITKEFT